MAITFLRTISPGGTANATSWSTGTITSAQANDVAVLWLSRWNQGSDSFSVPTVPAGAVVLDARSISGRDDWIDGRVYVVRLTGTAALSFSWSGQHWSTLDGLVFRGVPADLDLSTVAVGFATYTSSTATATPPTVSVTADAGSALAWQCNTEGDDPGSAAHTPPTGFTEGVDQPWNSNAYKIATVDGTQTASGAAITGGTESPIITTLVALPATSAVSPASGTASGTVTFASVSAGRRIAAGVAAGVVLFTAAASGHAPTVPVSHGAAAGSASWAADAAGHAGHAGTAAGSASWSGAASGSVLHTGATASGTTWTATASGHAAHTGAGTGTTAWTAAATGSAEHSGSPAATVTWTGSATGHAPTVGGAAGIAHGAWRVESTVAGSRASTGQTSGVVAWTATAAGRAPTVGGASGIAHGAWVAAGSTAGSRASTGSAAGHLEWTAAAAGSRTHAGSATSRAAWTGTATGHAGPAVIVDVVPLDVLVTHLAPLAVTTPLPDLTVRTNLTTAITTETG